MRLFLKWMRDNVAALVISTTMFVAMAVIMATMVNQDFIASLGSLFASYSEKAVSPFLWVWRAGGAVTWPTFFVLLLRRFRNPRDPKGVPKLIVVALAGTLYGGFGLWGFTEAVGLAAERIPDWGISIALMFLLLVELLSFAYTWGFCAIYALGLKSLTGRPGSAWVLPSIGFSALGRYIGQFLISFTLAIMMSIIIQLLALVSEWDGIFFIMPVALALCVGNFAGQWPSFWKAHDEVLGIKPVPPVPAYPATHPAGMPVRYGYPVGPPMPQGQAPMQGRQDPYAGMPPSAPQVPSPRYPYPEQPPEGNPPA